MPSGVEAVHVWDRGQQDALSSRLDSVSNELRYTRTPSPVRLLRGASAFAVSGRGKLPGALGRSSELVAVAAFVEPGLPGSPGFARMLAREQLEM